LASESTNKKGFVAGLVTAAVIATGILAALQIYDRITSNNARIVAEGDYTDISMPDQLVDELEKNNQRIDSGEIEKLLPEKLENRSSIAISVADALNKNRNSDALFSLTHIDHFLTFDIRNDGGREAADLKLELPVKGYYVLSRRGEKPVMGSFQYVIPIGNLRASNAVSIRVWTAEYFSEYVTKDVKITYPDGVIGVDFPSRVRGWYASFYYNIAWLLFLLFILGLIALLMFAGYLTGKEAKQKNTIRQSSENTDATLQTANMNVENEKRPQETEGVNPS
jgi:hypothetical protein